MRQALADTGLSEPHEELDLLGGHLALRAAGRGWPAIPLHTCFQIAQGIAAVRPERNIVEG